MGLVRAMESEAMDLRLVEERLRVAVPRLRFISGKPLERLQNGAPVPFAFQLSISTDRWVTVLSRDIERFVFSYDLWEEKFAVTKAGYPRKSISHLTARAAEAWCVDELSLAPSGIGARQQFWVRLDVKAENPAEQAELDRQENMSLTRLIEIFSRRARGDQERWVVDAGPFLLDDLKKGPRASLPDRVPMGERR
jgi:hypothetical protein